MSYPESSDAQSFEKAHILLDFCGHVVYHVFHLEEGRLMHLYFKMDLSLNEYTISQIEIFIFLKLFSLKLKISIDFFFKLPSNTRRERNLGLLFIFIYAYTCTCICICVYIHTLFLKISRHKSYIAFCRRLCNTNHLYD